MTMPPPGQWPPPPHEPTQGPSQWNPKSGPPLQDGNKAKWILGGLALLVVVVISVVATLLVTRGSSGSTTPTASAPPSTSVDASDVASANDRGPAGIITEDPTCAAWEPISRTLGDRERRDGWDKRDPSIPASAWGTELREQYEAVGSALRLAADQTAALAQRTPHRLMRVLYEQTIAYWRYFTSQLASYTQADNHFVTVAHGLAGTLNWICAAITYGSAAARSPLTDGGVPPLTFPPVQDPAKPERFLASPRPTCPKWEAMVDQYKAATLDWINGVDPNIPAAQWSPEQQQLFTSVTTILGSNAGEVQNLGVESGNPTWRDLAALAAQYRQAYLQAIPSYVPADNYLDSTASELVVAIDQACRAAGA